MFLPSTKNFNAITADLLTTGKHGRSKNTHHRHGEHDEQPRMSGSLPSPNGRQAEG